MFLMPANQEKKFFGAGIFPVLISLLLAAGCGSTYRQILPPAGKDLAGIRTVAVIPFGNLTAVENADEIVAVQLVEAILTGGNYSVIERGTVLKVVPEEIKASGVLNRNQARRIGQALGADAVLYGTVSEYRYQEGQGYFPRREPAVGIHARLVEVESGAVIGAVSVSRTGGGSFPGLLSQQYKQIYRTVREACAEVIEGILPAPVRERKKRSQGEEPKE